LAGSQSFGDPTGFWKPDIVCFDDQITNTLLIEYLHSATAVRQAILHAGVSSPVNIKSENYQNNVVMKRAFVQFSSSMDALAFVKKVNGRIEWTSPNCFFQPPRILKEDMGKGGIQQKVVSTREGKHVVGCMCECSAYFTVPT
jgi:hypothetical protein